MTTEVLFDALRGGTVELCYDPRQLRTTDVRKLDLGNDVMLAVNIEEPGVARFAFAGTERTDGNARLVRILFDEVGRRGLPTQISLRAARLNHQNLAPAALASLSLELGRRISDINRDGLVDISDFFLLVENLGGDNLRYDLNGDGVIDVRHVRRNRYRPV